LALIQILAKIQLNSVISVLKRTIVFLKRAFCCFATTTEAKTNLIKSLHLRHHAMNVYTFFRFFASRGIRLTGDAFFC